MWYVLCYRAGWWLEELVHCGPERNVRRRLELQDTQRFHLQIPVYVMTIKIHKHSIFKLQDTQRHSKTLESPIVRFRYTYLHSRYAKIPYSDSNILNESNNARRLHLLYVSSFMIRNNFIFKLKIAYFLFGRLLSLSLLLNLYIVEIDTNNRKLFV